MSARRRTGPIVFAITVALVAAVVGLTLSGRLPSVKKAWEELPFKAARSGSGSDTADATPRAPDAGKAKRTTGPLSSGQIGAPLTDSSFVAACGAPDDMRVVVKVSVKMGRAGEVDVKTDPPDPAVAACVEKAVRDKKWDVSPKTVHLVVTY